MYITDRERNLIDMRLLEDKLLRYSAKRTKLQRFWVPLQRLAPRLVLSLWALGGIASLFSQSYYPWIFTAPAICLLIVLEVLIEEVQIDLFLKMEETRYLLDVSRDLYSEDWRDRPGISRPPSHRY